MTGEINPKGVKTWFTDCEKRVTMSEGQLFRTLITPDPFDGAALRVMDNSGVVNADAPPVSIPYSSSHATYATALAAMIVLLNAGYVANTGKRIISNEFSASYDSVAHIHYLTTIVTFQPN